MKNNNRWYLREFTKKELTALKNWRYFWWSFEVVVIVVIFFLFSMSSTIIGLLLMILILALLIILLKKINLEFCLMKRKSIAKYIDKVVCEESMQSSLILAELKRMEVNMEWNMKSDKVQLNGTTLFRADKRYNQLLEEEVRIPVVEKYVTYEVLAYLFFRVRKCKSKVEKFIQTVECEERNEENEKRNKEKTKLDHSVFGEKKNEITTRERK